MEQILKAALIGGANAAEIEYIILDNVLINRDGVANEEERIIFSLEDMSDGNIKLSFRFERADIPRLVQVLGIPEVVVTETSNKVTGRYILKINS